MGGREGSGLRIARRRGNSARIKMEMVVNMNMSMIMIGELSVMLMKAQVTGGIRGGALRSGQDEKVGMHMRGCPNGVRHDEAQ